MMKNILFSPPDMQAEDIAAVTEVLKSGWITTGPMTKKFEQQLVNYTHATGAVCLNSATAAMELVLRVLGIGPGDEVITSAYTYTASASVICHVGATPILVDVAPNTYHISPENVVAAITPRTKAIIGVDLGGVMCDYDCLFDIVEEKKSLFTPANTLQSFFGRVVIIGDAAHSLGAVYHGRSCGSVADFTCFSFHAVKNLTTAEGGAILWGTHEGLDSTELYKQFMLFALHGQSKDALAKTKIGGWEYDIIMPGFKCNMTDISAALGISQLARYSQILDYRKHLTHLYNTQLSLLPVEVMPHHTSDSDSSYHLYLTRLIGRSVEERNSVVEKLAHLGIATNVHYKPLPLLTAYKHLGFKIEDYPNAYKQYTNEITLPLHTLLSDDDIAYIVSSLKLVL